MTTYDRANYFEEELINRLGTEELLNALLKAMDVDTKNDLFEYIDRCYLANEISEELESEGN